MNILRCSEYYKTIQMSQDFLDIIGNTITNESNEYKSVLKKIIEDLKLITL